MTKTLTEKEVLQLLEETKNQVQLKYRLQNIQLCFPRLVPSLNNLVLENFH